MFSTLRDFLVTYIGLFFLVFLFFSYLVLLQGLSQGISAFLTGNHSSRHHNRPLGEPPQAITIANLSLGIAFYLGKSLFFIFWFVLLFGYLILIIRAGTERQFEAREEAAVRKPPVARKTRLSKTQRICRSGRERILGGVCGGMAEYLDVDTVIIRLLWIIGSLAWDFGVLLYIIAWVIIPRNPAHAWR